MSRKIPSGLTTLLLATAVSINACASNMGIYSRPNYSKENNGNTFTKGTHYPSTHYIETGDPNNPRPPIILIPGFFGDTEGFKKVTTELGKSYHTIVVSPPGSVGYSEMPGDFGIREMVRNLENFIEELKVRKPFYLFGQSFGGLIAYKYASQHPEEIKMVVTYASLTDKNGSRFREPFGIKLLNFPVIGGILRFGIKYFWEEDDLQRIVSNSRDAERIYSSLKTREGYEAFFKRLPHLSAPLTLEERKSLEGVKAVYIGGDNDPLITANAASEKDVIIEGADHRFIRENPKEFIEILRNVLTNPSQ